MEDIKLWKANVAIRKMFGDGKAPVWFMISNETLDRLAVEKPESYLMELNAWLHLLFNQTFYRLDGGNIDVACVNEFDGKVMAATFHCQRGESEIWILSVEDGIDGVGWKSMKKQGRK